jgi:hypothetical protein
MSNGNKKIDKIESGFAMPDHPNDEIVWINTQSNTINVYNESQEEWVNVGGTAGTFDDPILKDNVRFTNSNDDVRLQIEHGGTGVVRIHAPEDDLALRSANDILLYAGDDGPGNVYIGWGDANITGDSSNKVATLGDLAYTRVNVPASSVGAEGDVAHLVADDTTHHYFCTGTWDGATNIWKRIEWSVDTWGV